MTKQELEYVLFYTKNSIGVAELEYDTLYDQIVAVEEQAEDGEITQTEFEYEYNELRHKHWIISEIIKSKK